MRAVNAAHEFIDVTFQLLDEYKSTRSKGNFTPIPDVHLQGPFSLRINLNGFLYLIEKNPDGSVKHTYSSSATSSFPAGELLGQYLTLLY